MPGAVNGGDSAGYPYASSLAADKLVCNRDGWMRPDLKLAASADKVHGFSQKRQYQSNGVTAGGHSSFSTPHIDALEPMHAPSSHGRGLGETRSWPAVEEQRGSHHDTVHGLSNARSLLPAGSIGDRRWRGLAFVDVHQDLNRTGSATYPSPSSRLRRSKTSAEGPLSEKLQQLDQRLQRHTQQLQKAVESYGGKSKRQKASTRLGHHQNASSVPLGWNTGGDPLVNMEGQAHHHVFSIYRPDRRKFYETRRTVTQTPVAGMPSRYGHPPW